MERLRYYSMIPNDKPVWLLKLQLSISQKYGPRGIEDTREEWDCFRDYVDAKIQELYNRRDVTIRSNVETALMCDEGKTVLLIKRNGIDIQTYYIKK